MTRIPSHLQIVGAQVSPSRDLATAPRALVQIGRAPDGLPLLCAVDRSQRLAHLYSTVARLFDCDTVDELPTGLRRAVEDELARGLMAVHPLGKTTAYITRRDVRSLFGRNLVDQFLNPRPGFSPPPMDEHRQAITAASAYGMSEAVEQAIALSKSTRHAAFAADGTVWTVEVAEGDRALRRPGEPFRRVVFESLAALDGVTAKFVVGPETWVVPLADQTAYLAGLQRATQHPFGGAVTYLVPRATILKILAGVAKLLGDMHRKGLVHGDLTPGNVLLDGATPVSFDNLAVEVGQIAAAATFEWAAPEQVTGRPLDPRADVYALGKMLCALVGGVPFGEKVDYIVPTGGGEAKTVSLLKTDGVFVDTAMLGVDRRWQAQWQEALGKLVAYDREKRLDSGVAVASLLAELAPPPGVVEVHQMLGELVPQATGGQLARVLSDG